MPDCGIRSAATGSTMRRGDLYWVDFDPGRGSEATKTRPAVIVSNDAANRSVERLGKGLVTVVPVTSNIARIRPFQTLLPAAECGLAVDSKAQAEQVRAVTQDRVHTRIGAVSATTLRLLDNALRTQLAL